MILKTIPDKDIGGVPEYENYSKWDSEKTIFKHAMPEKTPAHPNRAKKLDRGFTDA